MSSAQRIAVPRGGFRPANAADRESPLHITKCLVVTAWPMEGQQESKCQSGQHCKPQVLSPAHPCEIEYAFSSHLLAPLRERLFARRAILMTSRRASPVLRGAMVHLWRVRRQGVKRFRAFSHVSQVLCRKHSSGNNYIL